VADLVLDPVLHDVRTVAGAAGLERVVEDVHWVHRRPRRDGGAPGDLRGVPRESPYRLDSLVRRAQEADAAALLVVAWALWVSTEAEPKPEDARSVLRAVRLAAAAIPREWGIAAGIGRAHRGPERAGRDARRGT
jgi:hypothetical protein